MMPELPTVPEGPVETPPVGHVSEVLQLTVLYDGLDGVLLGDYDRRMLAWLAAQDLSAVATVASLLVRARTVGWYAGAQMSNADIGTNHERDEP